MSQLTQGEPTVGKQKVRRTKFEPGRVWLDIDGNAIESHWASLLFEDGKYYWYGTSFDGPTLPPGTVPGQVFSLPTNRGVTIYSSTNLYDWELEGVVLSETSYQPGDLLHPLNVLIRPKVIKNDVTGKYVMMAQLATPDLGYAETLNDVVVAMADAPAGPFHFQGKLQWNVRPTLEGIWNGIIGGAEDDPPDRIRGNDITLYRDDDGTGYLLSARHSIYLYKLSPDYGSVQDVVRLEGIEGEAPAVFKWKGTYFLILSGLTGWAPNENYYATATSIYGPWRNRGPIAVGPDSEITFGSQVTYVLKLPDAPDSFIYLGDRFNHTTSHIVPDFRAATHVWLPIRLNADDLSMKVEWHEEWDLSEFKAARTPLTQHFAQ